MQKINANQNLIKKETKSKNWQLTETAKDTPSNLLFFTTYIFSKEIKTELK